MNEHRWRSFDGCSGQEFQEKPVSKSRSIFRNLVQLCQIRRHPGDRSLMIARQDRRRTCGSASSSAAETVGSAGYRGFLAIYLSSRLPLQEEHRISRSLRRDAIPLLRKASTCPASRIKKPCSILVGHRISYSSLQSATSPSAASVEQYVLHCGIAIVVDQLRFTSVCRLLAGTLQTSLLEHWFELYLEESCTGLQEDQQV